MRNTQRGLVGLTMLCLIVPLSMSSPTAAAAEGECSASGGYSFVCGPRNAEDLVRVPGTKWIIASGMDPGAAIYLIDSEDKTWQALYPADAPRAAQDMDTFGACPGAPDPKAFVSHGLNLRPGAKGHSTLYVVAHGGREAIEVFDVDASGTTPVLTWTGCVPTPDGMEANSVASTADGALLATIPLHTGIDIGEAIAGNKTGGVYAWSPGDAVFTLVKGTELPYANGIEVSADGKEFYVASSGLLTVSAYTNTNPSRLLRSSQPLAFVPDNLHWGNDGELLTAGLNLASAECGEVVRTSEFSLEAFASCPRPFSVWAVNPQTMAGRLVAEGPANPKFSNITMALPVDDTLWIGTFGGNRVAYRSLIPSE